MNEDKKNPFLTIDIRVHFRGAVYRLHVRDVLRWLVPIVVIAGRVLWRHYHLGP